MPYVAYALIAVGLLGHVVCRRKAWHINRATPPYSLENDDVVKRFEAHETRWILAATVCFVIAAVGAGLVIYYFFS